MSKAGYLGPAGTFSEEAALRYTRNRGMELVGCDDIPGLIMSLEEGVLDIAIVPIENALEGTVNVTIDVLVHEAELQIIGEVVIPVRHCLMAVPGVTIDDIAGIMSHPQALAQCRGFLHKNLNGIPVYTANSTAAGAREVKASTMPLAAIGSRRAAEVFELNILKEGIEDNHGNSTRFVVLSKTGAQPSGKDKTSIAFTVNDEPGSLLQALSIFAEHGINLKKIESRPMRTRLGEYLFFVDFEGHIQDARAAAALDLLQARCSYYKHLGSYPYGND